MTDDDLYLLPMNPIKIKIVLNRCHGGFNLSDEALALYANAKGYSLHKSSTHVALVDPTGDTVYQDEIPRNDPDLVKIVEELGDKASSWVSKLEVQEIDISSLFWISEYDGLETATVLRRKFQPLGQT